jgi:peptidoglycan/xylan/chitin deacetylase (PgdA/CDA1 family)
LIAGDTLKIAVEASPLDANIIQELLSPWIISFTELDEADITIVYKQKPSTTKVAVMIPSDSISFVTWAKETGLDTNPKTGCITFVSATRQNTLTITPETQYQFGKLTADPLEEETSTEIQTKDHTVIIKIDLVEEFKNIINRILHPEQSKLHKVVTGLPIPYGLAPRKLRDFLMKTERGLEDLDFCNKLPIDALRFMLVNAIEKASGKKVKKNSLFVDSNVCLLTHDVETANGLQKTSFLRKIEEKYNVSSAWYVPSSRYKLDNDIIRELANHGEVGSHDTKHDGKLVHLKKRELVERLIDSRQTLEKITQKPVVGFRAPILQHNQTILQSLVEAGYLYDTSIPTWEPKHPYTMKQHGIGTVFPLKLNGLIEIPLTLTQDHQLLHVLRLARKDALKVWASMTNLICDIGGVCTFLVHPEYEIAGNLELYDELISALASNAKFTFTLPSKISSSFV